MTAIEKVAWTEFLVSFTAVVVVSVLFPWLGSKAHAGFGLLGLLVCSVWFVRRRGQTVVIDERDRTIERRATQLGVQAAWMALFLTLIVLVLWSSYFNDKVVATRLLTWLIWIQFAICYGVKGLVAILAYRKQRLAT